MRMGERWHGGGPGIEGDDEDAGKAEDDPGELGCAGDGGGAEVEGLEAEEDGEEEGDDWDGVAGGGGHGGRRVGQAHVVQVHAHRVPTCYASTQQKKHKLVHIYWFRTSDQVSLI